MSGTVRDTCAFCPKLCRHVCPVAAVTAREAATPTAIVGVVRLAERGAVEAALAEAALDLCAGCGACTRACALHLDVAAFVRECRPAPAAGALPALPPVAEAALLRVEQEAPAEAHPADVVVVSPDALGHAAWRAGEAAIARRAAAHFAGRRVATSSFAVAEVLDAGGVPVVKLDAPAGKARFLTCWEGATGADGQVACCGAREGFGSRNPTAASAMAREAARRLNGLPTTCADGHCAAWLRAHGADVRGPDADQPG
jgi:ferredoxin